MAVDIQVLAMDKIDGTTEVQVYSPSTSAPAKSAVVKAMRFVNVTSVDATLNVYLLQEGDTYATDKRHLFPKDVELSPGGEIVDDNEVTLGSGDKIYAQASNPGVGGTWFEFVVSGVERQE